MLIFIILDKGNYGLIEIQYNKECITIIILIIIIIIIANNLLVHYKNIIYTNKSQEASKKS